MSRILCVFVAFVAATLFAGCATHGKQLQTVRAAYFSGDLSSASSSIDELLEKPGRDADVLKLDRAMLELMSGDAKRAERTLRDVRDRLDYLEQSDAGELALSMATDDNRLAYAGEDYEKILVRTLLSLSSLMTGGEDAEAYALQINEKQQQIIDAAANDKEGENPKLAYKRIAIGPYIRAALNEERHNQFDVVERSRLQVVNWETDFRDGRQDLQRARHGRHSEQGNGVLYVFALVGRGPYKVEDVEIPTTAAMLIADRILSVMLKESLPPTIAPVKIPRVVTERCGITGVQVANSGETLGTTATITDVGELAVQQQEALLPQIVARAVVRRTLKKAAVYAVKDRVDANESPFVDLAFNVAGIAWEATERADTRCWGLLPDKIQVLRLELPAGEHRLTLQPLAGASTIGQQVAATVRIEDGRNSYLLANFPDSRMIGRVLTSP